MDPDVACGQRTTKPALMRQGVLGLWWVSTSRVGFCADASCVAWIVWGCSLLRGRSTRKGYVCSSILGWDSRLRASSLAESQFATGNSALVWQLYCAVLLFILKWQWMLSLSPRFLQCIFIDWNELLVIVVCDWVRNIGVIGRTVCLSALVKVWEMWE